MELSASDLAHIHQHLERALSDQQIEVEATFGELGSTAYRNIVQRLKEVGMEPAPHAPYLNIGTRPNDIRWVLSNADDIRQYCETEEIADKRYSVMQKTMVDLPPLILNEYGLRVKSRREVKLDPTDAMVQDALRGWKRKYKIFRYIRRYSFQHPSGLARIDVSIVKSSPKDPRGGGRLIAKPVFQTSGVLDSEAHFEVEVELLPQAGQTLAAHRQVFMTCIGLVLQGIQQNFRLIRRSVADQVRNEIKALTGHDVRYGLIGPQPVTLERDNVLEPAIPGTPHIRHDYSVTDKADGLRVHVYCDSKGDIFLIDTAGHVYLTGVHTANTRLFDTLLDAEWVRQTRSGAKTSLVLFFDMYWDSGHSVMDEPFYVAPTKSQESSRYLHMQQWETALLQELASAAQQQQQRAGNSPAYYTPSFETKRFQFPAPGKMGETVNRLLTDMKQAWPYHTDGIIFTPTRLAVGADAPGQPAPEGRFRGWQHALKWKPAELNTVDFLVRYENKPELHTGPDGTTLQWFLTMQLFVGGTEETEITNPRDWIFEGKPVPRISQDDNHRYRPIRFVAVDPEEPDAGIARVAVDPTSGFLPLTMETKEAIEDLTIVEMAYDPTRAVGWRWVPRLVRHDKTERFRRGRIDRTLNAVQTAQSIWNTLHDPVTESTLTTGRDASVAAGTAMAAGTEGPSVYYRVTRTRETDIRAIRGMRDFHNRFVKEDVLMRVVPTGGTLIDVAVGRAGDMQKWRAAGLSAVLGIDVSQDGITNVKDGTYRRYVQMLGRFGADRVPDMAFVAGDSAKRLHGGEAGETEVDRAILQGLLDGASTPALPPGLAYMAGRFKDGADANACMFALHYFFKDEETIHGLLRNVRETLKPGGYFIGCCFDGEQVFRLLQDTPQDGQIGGKDEGGNMLWTITKRYHRETLPALGADEPPALGLQIDVQFASIGDAHPEYLVFYPQLVNLMREHAGCEPISAEEAAALKLPGATEMFERTFDAAAKRGRRYTMSDDVRRFSFLNRWFVFRRRAAVVPRMPSRAPKTVAAAPLQQKPQTAKPSLRNAARRSAAPASTAAPPMATAPAPSATMMQPPATDNVRTITAVLPSAEEAQEAPSTVKKSRRKHNKDAKSSVA
jgi:SAM-dependent methyltransferase